MLPVDPLAALERAVEPSEWDLALESLRFAAEPDKPVFCVPELLEESDFVFRLAITIIFEKVI